MTVTTIPTEFALNEAMRSLALSTIIALCKQYKISSADLEKLVHQLARSEANSTRPQSRGSELIGYKLI